MSLEQRLKVEIRENGPIGVDVFMARCLHDPEFGYYSTRPALGPDGDFITAPLVSQMFGELAGLWAVEVWARLGAPSPFLLVEMGPGDGTLITDVLRAAHVRPAFLDAARLILIETSAPFRAAQQARLTRAGASATWIERLDQLPPGPMVLLANEVLDCLPAVQFVRTETGWLERLIGLDDEGELCFGLAPGPPGVGPAGDIVAFDASPGQVVEVSPTQRALGAQVGGRICDQGGCALFIDYGRDRREAGDTLQALMRHAKVDPLRTAGKADLTVWADFPSFMSGARSGGAASSGPAPQGLWLKRLGIDTRGQALARSAPDRAEVIARQRARLVDPDQMGELFKVAAIHEPGFIPPGFEEP